MEVLDKIRGIVDWWFKLKPGYTGIDEMLDRSRELSSLMYYLSEQVNSADKFKTQAETARKTKYNELRYKYLITEKCTVSKAETTASNDISEEISIENETAYYYRRLKTLHEASDEVLQTMRQHISRLKNEKFNSTEY